MKRIMALIDFSPITAAVLSIASDMARAFDGELILLHVATAQSELASDEARHETLSDADPQTDIAHASERQMSVLKLALNKVGVNVTVIVAPDPRPGASPIAKIAEQIARHSPDLIVLGSHGHGRLHQLLAGSTSDAVMRRAVCPVVLVPFRMADGELNFRAD
ncbi:MAG TPA: universal stress protein [Humisphaera sp.]|jgi:nucleotide-binding universal stress UspA family protein|nr:universal stress protein [Humisphaera sp.]